MTASKLRHSFLSGRSLLVAAASVGLFSVAIACTPKDQSASNSPAAASAQPDPHAPITEPPIPAPVTTNPLLGAQLFVDPNSLAMLQTNALRGSNPAQAAILDKIAQQPQGLWMGEWNSNIFRAVEHFVGRAGKAGAVPVIIAYNVPYRDYGAHHSEGGLATKEAYQRWIRDVHAGIGDNAAVIILEPDALPGLSSLPANLAEERLFLLNDAVRVLRQNPKAAVYLAAGHAAWLAPEKMAEHLKKAGIEYASGFSLNTSNYRTTEECLDYGHKISALVGGKHFVIDTSRNGAGPYESQVEEETWCNPPGRKIGAPPTTNTGDPLCDGFLWNKRPGESDGECNGGPKAGVWWMEQALEYAQ